MAAVKEFEVFNGEGSLRLRRKLLKLKAAGKAVLFIHGEAMSSSASFESGAEGEGWADFLARLGLDVYLLDLRGFGRSYRPEGAGAPVCTAEQALADVEAAVERVLSLSGASSVCLIGWSWGACVAGLYAEKKPHCVERVHLHAPCFGGNPAAASRLAAREGDFRSRSYVRMPKGELRQIFREDRVEELLAQLPEDELQVPSGPWLSVLEALKLGRPIFNPEGVKCPALVTRGGLDGLFLKQNALELLHRLSSAQKQLVLLEGGGHFMHLGREGLKLYKLSGAFVLEE